MRATTTRRKKSLQDKRFRMRLFWDDPILLKLCKAGEVRYNWTARSPVEINIENSELMLSAQVVVKGAIVGISNFCFVLYFL